MSVEKVEALVVGAGQAGVAMSEHLSRNGMPHLVLERDRIAERWRTGRWDSLVANGPAWHDRFPGMEFAGDPDAFAPKEAVADYFVAYAEKIAAPIRCGVEVTQRRAQRRPARLPRRDLGRARSRPSTSSPPPAPSSARSSRGSSPRTPGIAQMHSAAYRNPGQLPEGAVLVVGAGASGAQIADELLRGRTARLHLGRPARPPAAPLPRPRQRLVARRPQQVGRGGAADHRARHLRGQRRPRRPDRRLPAPRRARHDARSAGRSRSRTA